MKKIFGISGSFASGKDTLAHYLTDELGYLHVSTGDMVRAEAQKLRGSIERPVLKEVATELRRRHGAGYFAERALEELETHPDATGVVVTGLRSIGEANAITTAGGMLVFVDAPVEVRYERMKSRQRDNETALTLEEFKTGEEKEWHAGDDEADFNLRGIKQMADVTLENSADLEGFLQQAREKLQLAAKKR
ncbi:MAG: AAA family ATPase [Candidatus Saccharimonadales bacterium]